MTYRCEIWYRHNDEKDFFIKEIESDTPEQAIEEAKKLRRGIFKIEIV